MSRRTVEMAVGTAGVDQFGRPIRAPLAVRGDGALMLEAPPEPELEGDHMLPRSDLPVNVDIPVARAQSSLKIESPTVEAAGIGKPDPRGIFAECVQHIGLCRHHCRNP